MSPAAATQARTAPGTGLVVTVATGDDALALLGDDWDELVLRQRLPNPTLSAAWLRALAGWRTGTPIVAVAESQGRLVAGIALELRRPGVLLGPLLATWLGPAEQQVSPDLLVEPGRPDAGARLLARVLEEVQVLHVAAAANGPAAAALAEVTPWRRIAPIGQRWTVACPPARHAYATRRIGSELRHAERLGARVDVAVHSEPAAVDAALVRLFRIHRDRWHGRADLNPRFASSSLHRRWNRDAVAALAAAGGVRLVEVIEDGRTQAACLGMLVGRGGLAHTQAMRDGGRMREPGHLALLECVDALGAAGAELVDLSVGTAQPGTPKARLGAEPETMLGILATRSAGWQRPIEVARRGAAAARRMRGR